MKAIRYYGKNDIRCEEIPKPAPEPGGLIVKVEACALCGTDLKMYLKGDPRVPAGQTIGHEFVGTISQLGKSVTSFHTGQRVTMATSISCGRCSYCRRGFTNRCDALTPISRTYPGALASYISIPSRAVEGGNVICVPDGIGDLAALAEPLSCVINAQSLAKIQLGDTVVVRGFGPLGALHAQAARARGATRILAVQRSKERRERARAFAIDAVIDPQEVDPVAEVLRLTEGMGADVSIVCAPNLEAQQQAFGMVRKGGMVNLFAGLPSGESTIPLDTRLVHYREISVSGGSDSTPHHVELAVRMLNAGWISDDTVTHRLPLERFTEGLSLMRESRGLKIVLNPE
jgi:L-iditol 2-dehydrogenase